MPSQPLTILTVVADAAPLNKLLFFALIAAGLAAVVLCATKLTSGPRLAGGSLFLSSLRLGGPIAGLLGGSWSIFHMCLGLANVAAPVPAQVLARGWAEAAMLVTLGLVVGAVAVMTNWAIEARIDHAVLRG
jgi:hypothetical protein